MKLYELAGEYKYILSAIENEEVKEENIKNFLNNVKGDFETKIENTAKVIRTLELEEKALKEEEDRLKSRRKTLNNNILNLKEYVENSLKATGIEKIKGKVFTIGLQKNPLKLNVVNLEGISAEYKEVVMDIKIDKKAILQHFKETGEILEGVEIEQSKSLRIR